VAILQTALRIKLLLIVYRSLIANPPFSFGWHMSCQDL
jgi:hypothetical protein